MTCRGEAPERIWQGLETVSECLFSEPHLSSPNSYFPSSVPPLRVVAPAIEGKASGVKGGEAEMPAGTPAGVGSAGCSVGGALVAGA